MCLGVPGKIVSVYEKDNLPMGRVDYGGIIKEACLTYVPSVQVGDYVVVHVGFAISQLEEEEALATLQTIKEVEDIAEALGEERQP